MRVYVCVCVQACVCVCVIFSNHLIIHIHSYQSYLFPIKIILKKGGGGKGKYTNFDFSILQKCKNLPTARKSLRFLANRLKKFEGQTFTVQSYWKIEVIDIPLGMVYINPPKFKHQYSTRHSAHSQIFNPLSNPLVFLLNFCSLFISLCIYHSNCCDETSINWKWKPHIINLFYCFINWYYCATYKNIKVLLFLFI